MADSHLERWGAASLLAVCALIGVPILLADEPPTTGPPWVWWSCYLGLIALFVLGFREKPPERVVRRLQLPGLALTGAATVLLAPRAGYTAILLVFITAYAAHLSSWRTVVALLLANSTVAGGAAALGEGTVMEIALTGLIYAMLQLCTVWAVRSEQREAAARRRLAAANTDLRAATALLAESSRAGERLRIARELHDLLGHQLTALVLELEVASHRSDPAARKHVERARGLARELLGDVRTAVGELRTGTPDLRRALAEVVAELPYPRVHLDVDATLEPDEACAAALIRCVQEAVTNTIRHSGAANLWIDVARSGAGEIVLTARDDGRGTSALRLGHGLTGIRERVAQLGGAVSFDTRAGFTLSARVPAP
ncbi:sensor histidine kinase [Actinomadura sp. 21ATH]|uniref:sensor histidine kinase n=1 Tax=Actinomadura sp. 21ATH TaxID=1735444 RepID=UPI0035C20334